jgi:phosphoribosyl 1,2-cyclic phosphodiesterase
MAFSDFSLTVLGSRGSMAFGGEHCSRYGGDSSCYMVRAGEETVFLDGGTGICAAPSSYPKDPVVLLTHLHLDHIVGLGMFPALSNRELRVKIYVPFCRTREEAEGSLGRIYAPPFWPVRLTEYTSSPELLPLPDQLTLGALQIDAIPGNHPGGCMVFRLRYEGKSIVYVTDYEYEESSFERLVRFSEGADLLLFDAQYSDAELPAKHGFGHASAGQGIELMARSDAKRLLLIHHDPQSFDRVLAQRETLLTQEKVEYARTGQRIVL